MKSGELKFIDSTQGLKRTAILSLALQLSDQPRNYTHAEKRVSRVVDFRLMEMQLGSLNPVDEVINQATTSLLEIPAFDVAG